MKRSIVSVKLKPILYSRLLEPNFQPVLPYSLSELCHINRHQLQSDRAINLDMLAKRLTATATCSQHQPFYQLEFFYLLYTSLN